MSRHRSRIWEKLHRHSRRLNEFEPENDFQPPKRMKRENLSNTIPEVKPCIDNIIRKRTVQGIDYNNCEPKLLLLSSEEKKERREPILEKIESSNPNGVTTFYVCSREGEAYANILKTQHEVQNAQIVLCNDIEFFSKKHILPEWCEVMFLIVDTHFLQIVMRKQRLFDVVYDYFSDSGRSAKWLRAHFRFLNSNDFENSSKVYLVNKLPKEKEWHFQGLKYQLPEAHVKDYTEIEVAVTKKQPPTPRTDGDLTSPDLHTGDKCDITPNQPAQNTNTVYGSLDGACLQIGDKSAIHITKSKGQVLYLRQDGNDNSINVTIVPKKDVTKIEIVATDPTDPAKDKVLKQELDEKTERINLKLKYSGIQIVEISSGSVIIKLQATEGQYVDNEMMEKVINIIFGEVENETMNFKLDIESSVTALAVDCDKIMTRKEKDIHRNCVNKDQYDDLNAQLAEARKEIKAFKTANQRKSIQPPGVPLHKHQRCVRELEELRRKHTELERQLTCHTNCVPRVMYQAQRREHALREVSRRPSPEFSLVPSVSSYYQSSNWNETLGDLAGSKRTTFPYALKRDPQQNLQTRWNAPRGGYREVIGPNYGRPFNRQMTYPN